MKEIQLGGRNGYKIRGYTIVDDGLFDSLNKYCWCLNKKINLGYFSNKEEAIKIYNEVASIYFGSFYKPLELENGGK